MPSNSSLIGIHNATFTWSSESTGTVTPGSSRRNFNLQITGEIVFKQGKDAINKYHSVQHITFLIQNFHGTPAFVAFVEFKSSIAEDHITNEKEVFKMYVSEHLLGFMYPSLIAHPLTLLTPASGKVSRCTLMELGLAPLQDTNVDVGLPRSGVEAALHKIFSDILKINPSQLDVTHDLF